ncbi:hypothetical protein CROQUDRAFT_86451 [Cronartium quercuum f. sp. fusiforme G11]|uniref:Uncharacterized protein n=1 Tax=Cronartium quercuum f. sp. fusiforme G11 TaxID=708437 RepID=A0A9P6TGT9_9BASI|nr:hypothetical protein CROQUDRAFT_86451 [Cronartium quercuum f. sp. fusiforme G11]
MLSEIWVTYSFPAIVELRERVNHGFAGRKKDSAGGYLVLASYTSSLTELEPEAI